MCSNARKAAVQTLHSGQTAWQQTGSSQAAQRIDPRARRRKTTACQGTREGYAGAVHTFPPPPPTTQRQPVALSALPPPRQHVRMADDSASALMQRLDSSTDRIRHSRTTTVQYHRTSTVIAFFTDTCGGRHIIANRQSTPRAMDGVGPRGPHTPASLLHQKQTHDTLHCTKSSTGPTCRPLRLQCNATGARAGTV
jgi:hypothetical protein